MERRKTSNRHTEEGDKVAVTYAAKYAPHERDFAIRAFREGWKAYFDNVEPAAAWDVATKYASTLRDEYDFHATRLDVLAGYNAGDDWRKGLGL